MGLNRARAERPVAGLAARRLAVGAVDLLMSEGRALDDALETLRDVDADPSERAFAGRIARLAVRHLGTIGRRLEARLDRGVPKNSGSLESVLIVGAAEILHAGTPPHAAVDMAVRVARSDPRAVPYSGLVNAVLRRIAEAGGSETDPLDDLPEGLAQRWRVTYGADVARAMAAAIQTDPPLDLSVARDPALWAERLGGRVLATGTVRLDHPVGALTAMPGFAEGAWWVQDAAARLAVLALGDVRGRRVLDMCAAPGGKTAALAAAGAHVTALDRSEPRAKRLAANLDRLGLSAEIVIADGAVWRPEAPFDAVLIDAPCTATGTLRRHPDVAWLKDEDDIAKLAGLQRRLVANAPSIVRPGGRIVYATCSLEPEEGEAQADAALAGGLEPDPIRADEIGGLSELIDAGGRVRARPDHLSGQGGLDGFFVARFRVPGGAGRAA